MITGEVKFMEQEKETQAQSADGYEPRPAWQVWAARVGLVLFLLIIVYQLVAMVSGNF